ncbi:MAG: 2-oxoglutarate dehydrogenase complex dihydrolipoyllysine-residue succinyltransferase [Candidatus Halichondribacter symbioticus]
MSKEISEVRVPTLGESVTEATIAKWHKKAGDAVARDEIICELETDKVSVEVSAAEAGVLAEIIVAEGANVGIDALLATIKVGDMTGAAGDSVKNGAGAEESPVAPDPAPATPANTGGNKTTNTVVATDSPPPAGVKNAPSAEKLMLDHNLQNIAGTGRDGRIMKADVLAALDRATPITSTPAKTPQQGEERVKMTRLRQTIAKRLKDSQNTAAMLTTYNEVDMSAIIALRASHQADFVKKHGIKLGFMAFFTKACCHVLKEVPEVNSEIDGDEIVYKNYVNMGIAVGTPNGLVVPVLRDADQMSFADVEKNLFILGQKARDGQLAMDDLQGGSFTISNGGIYGSMMSSPILNPPQSGILGMHAIQKRAVVVEDAVVVRPMMYLALSYDHRVVDGKGAVTFLVRVRELLEDPARLLIDV